MKNNSLWRWVLVMLLAVAALGTALPTALAQDDGDDDDAGETETLIGFVTFDENGDLMVAGIYVAPSGVFNPSELDEGDLVLVEGYYLNETTFKATGFELLEEYDECADDGEDGGEVGDDAGDDDDDAALDEEDPCAPTDDEDDDDADSDDDDGACGDNEHPVLTSLADEFGVDYEVLSELHCDGVGVGNIAKLLLIAEAAGVDFDEVLGMYLGGMNVNQIARELDIKVTAVGHAHNGKHDAGDDDDGDEVSDAPGHSGDAPGQSGDNPGHGGTPPGQDKDKDKDKGKDK